MSQATRERQATAALETLEPRLLLAVTAEEQLFVYLLNLARHDPVAYQQEAGLSVSLAGIAAQPPLAINENLCASAKFHAKEMADYDYFDHVSWVTWEWPNKMARNAGYDLPLTFPDNENNIESIAGGTSTAATTLKMLIQDSNVNPPGHRIHLLATNPFFQSHREIGVGHVFNVTSTYRDYWAIHTAYRLTPSLFVTGVTYNDLDLDGRYDLNEGLGNVGVTIGGVTVWTNPYGGYSFPVTTGKCDITVQGGTFNGAATASVDVLNQNVEVDFISGHVTGIVNFSGASAGAPAAPASVSAWDGISTEKVHVTWTPSPNATSYEVWRSETTSSAAAAIQGTPTGTSYDDTSAIAGTTYYYWVKAKNGSGTSVFSLSNAGRRNAAATIALLTPDPDTFLRGVPLTLTATGVADTDGTIARVQFYRDVNNNGTYEPVKDTPLGYGTLAAGVWSWTGATTKFPYGTVGVLARALDNNSAWSAAAAATLTVLNPDPEPPTAALVADDILASPGARHLFQVTYSDNVAVDASDIGARDVRVKGPKNSSALATFVSASTKTDGTPITATYAVTAPGGAWDFADNGPYTVYMEPNQVSDTNDNFVAAAGIGTFNVNLPDGGDQVPTITKVTLPAPLVPGDRGSVSVVVRNIGGTKAGGTSVDRLYLSPKPDDLTGAFLLAARTSTVNLGAGQTRTITFNFIVPADAAPDLYYVVADINATGTVAELHLDNNQVATAAVDLVWQFGDVGTRKRVLTTLCDADGTWVTFRLTGAGAGAVTTGAEGLDVALAGTTNRSAVTVTTKKTSTPGDDGKAALGDISVGDAGTPGDQTSLGTFTARTGNLAGNFSVTGTLSTLTLDDVTGNRQLDILNRAGAAGAVAFAFDQVADLSIASAMPIRSLTATEWLDAGGDDGIEAPSLGTLTIRGRRGGPLGNFEGNLTLNDAAARQSLSTMTVAGWLQAQVRAASAIGSVTAGGLRHASLFAGAGGAVTGLPQPATDFVASTSIRSVRVGGIKGETFSTIDSSIAAWNLGTITLVGVKFDNGITPFGLAAHTLSRLSYRNGTTYYYWPNPKDKSGPPTVQQFEVRLAV